LGLAQLIVAQAAHFYHHLQKGEDHPVLATSALQLQAEQEQKALMDCSHNNIQLIQIYIQKNYQLHLIDEIFT
jgi:hypothetical protein